MSLHPEYPIVDGTTQLSTEWSLSLDQPHSRRIDDGSLVLWRLGFTIWLNIWDNPEDETIAQRLDRIKSDRAAGITEIVSERLKSVHLFAYRLLDENENGQVDSYNAFVISPSGHLQMSIYFDDPNEITSAKAVAESVRWGFDG